MEVIGLNVLFLRERFCMSRMEAAFSWQEEEKYSLRRMEIPGHYHSPPLTPPEGSPTARTCLWRLREQTCTHQRMRLFGAEVPSLVLSWHSGIWPSAMTNSWQWAERMG